MRRSNGGNPARVTRRREPVVNSRPDLPALNGRLSGAMVSGNQQDDPISLLDRPFETPVYRTPCTVEIHPVKIEDPVGCNGSRAETPVPMPVEVGSGPRLLRHDTC